MMRAAFAEFPLTLAQSDIYLDQQRFPADPIYNIGGYIRMQEIDLARLRDAHRRLVLDNEAFGLRMRAGRDGVVQYVSAQRNAELPEFDFSAFADPEAEARAWMQERFQHAFDLHDSELYLACVLRVSSRQHWYCVIAHHLMIDGWGYANLAHCLAGHYRGESQAPSLQWREVANDDQEYVAGARYVADRDYWAARIGAVPDPLLPPYHRRRFAVERATPSGRETTVVPLADYARLADLAAHYRVGLPQLLLGAFALCVSRLADSEEAVIGLPVHNRRGHAQKRAIGVFTGMLPLALHLPNDTTFAALLQTLAERQRSDYRRQRYPIGHLGRDLGIAGSGRSLFDASFNYLKLDSRFEVAGRTAEIYYLSHGYSQAPLALTVWEYGHSQPVEFHFDHNLAYLDAVEARMFAARFHAVLRQLLETPGIALDDIVAMTEGEATRCAGLALGPPASVAGFAYAHQLFQDYALRRPEAVAVVDDQRSVSYGELERRANRLARTLRDYGVRPDDRVALCGERDWTLMLGVLGILKAGGAYLPIDPSQPDARIAAILADAMPVLCLTSTALRERIGGICASPLLALDAWVDDAMQEADEGLDPDAIGLDPGHLAYVIYTSGSSGTPKGVMLEHASLAHLTQSLRDVYGLGADDRVLQFSSIAFDAATWDWARAFAAGATLYICPEDARSSGEGLGRYLLQHGITHALIPPAALAHLDTAPGYALRSLIIGGDVCDARLADAWTRKCRLFNAYGPTEATVVVSQAELTPGTQVTIGSALPGYALQVVDRAGRLAAIGAPGELWIAGPGLARGYLGRADLTAARFGEGRGALAGQRWYRSGDRVRRNADGALEFLGRVDAQVKIRGFRIEPGEVESALHRCEQLASAFVGAVGEGAGKRLVAWIVAAADNALDDAALFAALRTTLRRDLPEYMIPTAWVRLERMPLNTSGKVDRRALPMPPAVDADVENTPDTETERRIERLWCEVLGIPRADVDRDFFALGGHSLLAARLAVALSEEFGRSCALRDVFEHRSIRQQALHLEHAAAASAAIVPAPAGTPLPLSFQQRRLWLTDRIEGAGAHYNIPAAMRLLGELDRGALAAALQAVAQHHAVLRTVYAEHDGEPVQTILPRAIVPRIVDASTTPEHARHATSLAYWRTEASTPFDLAADLPLRVVLVAFAPRDHTLLLTLHHIAADGWSIEILVRELGAAYAAAMRCEDPRTALLAPSVQYADYAVWQRRTLTDEALAASLDFWSGALHGAPPLHALPLDRLRAPQPDAFGHHFVTPIAPSAAAALRGLAQAHDATVFMALRAALAALLWRWSGETDLMVGVPVAGRDRPEVAPLIGFFVNTLALRSDVSGDPTFTELLVRSREEVLSAFAHQLLPFDHLVHALAPARVPGAAPLYQIMLSFGAEPLPALELSGVDVLRYGGDAQLIPLNVDLDVAVERDGDSYAVRWHYRADLFDAASVERLACAFHRLLEAAVASPQQRIGALPLLGVGDAAVLDAWEGTGCAAADSWAHERIAAQAMRAGTHPALVDGGVALDYATLDAQANRLAQWLRARGIGEGACIGVCLARGWRQPLAALAVLKAGAAYVPLDPVTPQARLRDAVVDAGIAVVLSTSDLAAELDLGAVEMALLDAPGIAAELEAMPAQAPPLVVTAATPAYVIFTSGSSGRPKGVVVGHGALAAYLDGLQTQCNVGPADRLLQFASFGFDVYVEECFMALCHGATLVLRDEETLADGERFCSWVMRHRISVLNLPTAFWHTLVETLSPEVARMAADVRLCMIGGEAAQPGKILRWNALMPPTLRLLNGYGPTEATVTATVADLADFDAASAAVPIGRPLPHVRCRVLGTARERVPVGVAGELYLGGASLALGYLRQEALTAERFVQLDGERWYRSGDRVRWRNDGQLEFLGRLDDQVKLRGFRIELGEIRLRLEAQAGVASAFVQVLDCGGEPRLAAWVVPTAPVADIASFAAELRHRLGLSLPGYMVPWQIVPIDAFPLTPSGKVDARALPEPAVGQADFVAPSTDTERVVAQVWSELLGGGPISADDDFFELGGHSLLAMRVVGQLSRALRKLVGVRTLFEHPSVRRLAACLDAMATTEAVAIVPVERGGLLPLSSAQEQLWFLAQLAPDSTAYHMSTALRLHGAMCGDALRAAFAAVVARHEALRTVFVDVDGIPMQAIRDDADSALSWTEIAGADGAALEAAMRTQACTPFDLGGDALLRVCLAREAEDRHVLLVSVHHIVFDGWSMAVLMDEVAACYTALREGRTAPLPPLSIQYADYAVWQRAQADAAHDACADYWTRTLEGAPRLLELPTDRPRPARQVLAGDRVPIVLDAGLTAALRALGRRRGATLFTTLLAGWATLMARLSGQEDLVLGIASANREREEVQGLIGFFVNSLALRLDALSTLTVAQWIDQTQTRVLEAQSQQALPFDRVVQRVAPTRNLTHSPVFQAFFAWQDGDVADLSLPGMRVEPMASGEVVEAKFDLSLALHETAGGGVEGVLEYAMALFDRETVQRFVACWRTLLRAMADGDALELAELPLLDDAQRLCLLRDWSGRILPYADDEKLEQRFDRIAASMPDAIAIVEGERNWRYAELAAHSRSLARRLRAHGIVAGDRVAIEAPRSALLVAAQIAALRCGAIYVPLDPNVPQARRDFMLDDSAARVLLVPTGEADELELRPLAHASQAMPGEGVDAVAYVMYTSGSTGRPKGVAVTHRGVRRLVVDGGYGDFSASDRVAFAANPAFDASTLEVWMPLCNGGRLVIVDQDTLLEPLRLAALLEREAVTVLWMTVGLFNHYAEEIGAALGRLRVLMIGGDALDSAIVARFLASHPQVRLFNGYGPTETTTFALTYPVVSASPGQRIPIGLPIRNTRIYVLDARREPVPVGVVGELYIGGDGVAACYLNLPELTAERFLPDPFLGDRSRMYRSGDRVRWRNDGTVEFIGRTDRQVKIRGFRVELGEIEACIGEHPGVRDAIVVAQQGASGRTLAAYVVFDASLSGVDAATTLHAHLAARMPDYMLPQGIVALERFPLTANGKVDVRALPQLTGADGGLHIAPATRTEQALAEIWQRLLGRERVGRSDNFFVLGGHSLLATRVAAEIGRRTGVKTPVRMLFELPELHALAAWVDAKVATDAMPIAKVDRAGRLPLSSAQERLWFLAQLEPESTAYHVPLGLRLRGELDRAALRMALERVVARHDALRTVFVDVDGTPAQVVTAAGSAAFDWEYLDARDTGDATAHLAVSAQKAFDLAHGPLLRACLVREADTRYALRVTVHHIVFDGWSVGLLIDEIATQYTALRAGGADLLPPLPIQYVDYAAWQRAQREGPQQRVNAEYWRRALAGAPGLLELPTDRPRPMQQSFAGQTLPFVFDTELTSALKVLGMRRGTTLFTVVLASWTALLARLSGQQDLVVGIASANRGHEDVHGLIGLFVNSMALRFDLSCTPTVAAWIEQVRTRLLEAQAHQDLPFDRVVDLVAPTRSPAHSPLFQAFFAWEDSSAVDLSLPGLQVEALAEDVDGEAMFDLSAALGEVDGRIVGALEYATALFDRRTIERIVVMWRRLARAMAEDELCALSVLPLLDDTDLSVLQSWEGRGRAGGGDWAHERIAAQAMRAGAHPALVDGEVVLDYATLETQANRLAQWLRARGIGEGACVGVCLARSWRQPLAALAVLKAGAAYVPLDPAHPQVRLRDAVEDACIGVVLSTSDLAAELDLGGVEMALLDAPGIAAELEAAPAHAPPLVVSGVTPAYVIFTSGSSGRPKGVVVGHGALAAYLDGLQAQCNIGPADRLLQFASFGFDAYIEECFMALCHGATLVLRDEETITDGERFWSWVVRHRISVLNLPTAFWHVLVETLPPAVAEMAAGVRLCVIGGEAAQAAKVLRWNAAMPLALRLLNTYGPTEATVTATAVDLTTFDAASAAVPIGRPLPHVRCRVLGTARERVPVGVAGELYLGGASLALGYLRQEALTAEHFVQLDGERWYRSGDRVRWRNDGQLEFLGRLDDQVKLRGFRIELGEIESRLHAEGSVREAVVVVRGEGVQARLVAYVTPAAGEAAEAWIDELQAALAASLPGYMQPSAYVVLEALPLTVNGKVDKGALPEPVHARGEEEEAPSTETERALAQIWSGILGHADIGVTANFFALGGHSLLATRIVSEIGRALGKQVPVRALFEQPTLRGLAQYVERQARSGYAPIPKVPRVDALPLSFAQQRLWFIDRLEGGSTQYNMPVALRLRGGLSVAALGQALAGLLARHEVLRTVYREVDGTPWQVIQAQAQAQVPLAHEDLSALPAEAQDAAVQAWVQREAGQGFDLAHEPMLRCRVLRLEAEEHAVLFTLHHIASDGWSMGVLVREFVALYAGALRGEAAALAPLPVQYADYAAWQRERLQGASLEAALGYWRERLQGLPAVHGLPLDRPRPARQAYASDSVDRLLSPVLLQMCKDFAAAHDATLFMVLEAALAALIARWSGEHDVAIGTPISGRAHQELEPLIGFFINTVVLRNDLSGDPDFQTLLARTRRTALDAYAHDIPFELIVDEIKPERSLAYNPLCQIKFMLQHGESEALALPDAQVDVIDGLSGSIRFDFDLNAVDTDDGLQLYWSYQTALFDRETLERMAHGYECLLAAALREPGKPFNQLPLQDESLREQLLTQGRGPHSERGREQPLIRQLQAQAQATPEAVAVRCGAAQMTYRELDRASNRLAQALAEQGVGLGARVGVALERSLPLLVALLGVMKSGAAYVPVDAQQAPARVQAILEDAEVALVLGTGAALAGTSVQVLAMDGAAEASWLSAYPDAAPAVALEATHSAYVLYTSGSTGVPKGVEVLQRGLTDYCAFARGNYYAEHLAGALVATSPAFDLTVPSLYVPLLAGGCVTLLAEADAMAGLAAALEAASAPGWLLRLTPSHVQGLLALSDAQPRPGAHVFVVGGEAFAAELAQALRAKYPQAQVYNHYGPTEAVVGSSWYAVDGQAPCSGMLPIGRAMENTTLYVLDARMGLQPAGVAGELYIGGWGVAKGYVKREALTAERFVASPFVAGERLYRSGDRVRWRNDGQLEFLGRLDDQVKLRGFRIELGEIESRLHAEGSVREAVVVVRGEGVQARLVAYVTPAAGEAAEAWIDELQAALASSLPGYMQPSAYVVLEALPLTVNGKVDKGALPEPVHARGEEEEAPSTETERALAQIWSGILGHADIGVTANFFALGGHSLLATRIVSEIGRALGKQVPVRALFEQPTLRGLAQYVERQARSDYAPIPKVPRVDALPLSFAQQRLWFIDRLEGGSTQYNMPVALRLRGGLSVAALGQALAGLLARHEVLRTVYREVDGTPWQVIQAQAQAQVPLAHEDLSALPAEAQDAAVQAWVQREAGQGFDLAHEPMLRCRVLRLEAEEHAVLFTLHHIASDGWSMGVLVREFVALYAGALRGEAAALAPLPVQYADYAAWQRERLQGASLEAALGYWRERLQGLPAVHGLPLDRPRPARQDFAGGRIEQGIAAATLAGLQALAQRHDASLFMVLEAALAWLLARWSGERDIVIGTPIAGRVHPDVEPLIGFFVNTLVLRTQLSGEETFEGLLETTRERVLEAYTHQEIPFEMLVDELKPVRSLSHAPLFQVLLSMRNTEQVALTLPGLEVSSLGEGYEQAKFDLQLAVQETGEGLRLVWGYATRLFEAASIDRLAQAYAQLLAQIVVQPDAPLATLPLIEESERAMLAEWNANQRPLPDAGFHRLFARQATATPDAIAVRCGPAHLTYRELDEASSRLAHDLRNLGVDRGALVALCLERSIDLPLAILGVLKAGAAWLPLDPAYPDAHLQYVLGDSATPFVLGHAATAERLSALGVPARMLDAQEISRWPRTAPEVPGESTADLAYAIYTSGSTGRPKGVLIEHRSLSNLALNLGPDGIADGVLHGCWALVGSHAFDGSIKGLMQLAWGGSVLIVPEAVKTDPAMLRALLRSQPVVLMDCTPSLLESWLAAGLEDCLPNLVIGGEAISSGLWRELVAWQSRTGRKAINVYGPTECCVDATWSAVLGEAPTIGRNLVNVECRVLSPAGAQQPIGVPGELYIGGVGVGRGYHRHPELTAERFVQLDGERWYRSGDRVRWRNDGQLEFLGRLDDQVKLRGFRIELGEIESRLHAEGSVREAVVVVRGEGVQARLVAYVTPAAGEAAEAWIDELQAALASSLPGYMQPSAYVVLEALPLTVNGKVDKGALPEPVHARGEEEEAPSTETERALAQIWSGILGHADIGVTANFFALGGHSLLATRIVSEIGRALGKQVPVRALFEQPTLRGLAQYVERQARSDYAPIPKVPRVDALPLSFAQQRLWFIDRLEGGSTQYNMPVALRLRGGLSVAALGQALAGLLARHEVLRTVYREVDGTPWQVIQAQAQAQVPLAHEDLSALPAEAQDAAVQAWVQREAGQGFDLAHEPMLRCRVLRLEAEEHAVLFTLHHIASDGWSMGVLVREFVALYAGALRGEAAALAPLPVQYADYAAWQRERLQGASLEAALGYWRERLQGLPAVHGLPLDRPRPARQDFAGGRIEQGIAAATLAGLQALAQRHDASLFMVLEAALAWLLARWSGERDIVIGTPIAGRVHPDVEPLIGFFVNTLVLRTQLSGEETFEGLLETTRERVLEAYTHQEIPFEMLVDELKPVRSLSHAPLFQVLLSMRNTEQVALTLPGLEVSSLGEGYEQAKFDLQLAVQETGEGLRLVWGYATRLFEAASIDRLAQAYAQLLAQIVVQPDAPLAALCWQDAAAQAQLLAQGRGPHSERGREQPLIRQLQAQAQATPEAVAVRCGAAQLTYRELDRASNRLAQALAEQGVGLGARVGVALERSLPLLVALLGVMKSGAAYVPVDAQQAPARVQAILEDAEVALVLGTGAALAGTSVQVLAMDGAAEASWLSAYPDAAPAVALEATHSAYVLYTSGSTGVPKGVEVLQRGLTDYCAFARGNYYAEHLAGALVATSPAFDLTVPSLYVPLLAGGCVTLLAEADAMAGLAAALEAASAPGWLLRLTPSHVQGLLALSDAQPRPGAHVFVVGGEAFAAELAQALRAKYPQAQVYNHYGPTEAVVGSSWYAVDGQAPCSGMLPIGRAMENTTLYVLDARMGLQPAGVAGELYIGGWGVAKGYVKREALTAERFVASPFVAGERLYRSGDRVRWRNDGQLEFLGRLDDQVKLRGFRIELGEIESRLHAEGSVREAVVVVRGEAAQARLVAYVTPAAGEAAEAWIDELKAALAASLPGYMQPSAYVVLEALPLTVNGKVDKGALPEPVHVRGEEEAPSTETERALAQIWSDVLGHADISVTASFFDLGGHSLLATRLINAVQRRMEMEVSIRLLFERSDIRSVAALIDAERLRRRNRDMAMEAGNQVETEW
ncbi:non-ribosomal peptide synthetase [Xanthomonas sp. SI]|nr:non-ribosomal peptide synthetase [Xanthomonas sp. SI]